MTIGDKLSRLRKENNYTQEQLADILGVSRQAISKWESDVAYPETDKLIRLSALYHCSLDYLVRDDLDTQHTQPPQPQQQSGVSEKVNKLLRGILRFAPVVLYALWALLLWAFYAAPFFKLSDNNLYQWFGRSVVEEFQPEINALISLGVISSAYIVALGVLQRFAGKKLNLIANLCSFVFQAGVFVCVMCLIGVAKSVGLESGKVVVVTATLTGVFALLQAVFIALGYYFNNGESIDLKPRKTIAAMQKLWKFITLHKVVAIVVAFILIVGIVLSIVLPLVLRKSPDNIFETKRVSQIQLGDSRDEVREILGEPLDVDTDKLAKIIGNDEADAISKKNLYYYCSPNAADFIKKTLRLLDEVDEFSSSPDVEDAKIIYVQLNKLLEELNDIEFQYIEVYFENGRVSGVEYDSKFSLERENDVKWDSRGTANQNINVTPDKIPYDETPYSTELFAQIFYSDGSYRLSKIENVSVSGSAQNGWTIEFSDHWGNYRCMLKGSGDMGKIVKQGAAGNGVSYLVTEIYKNNCLGYVLTFEGEGSMYESEYNHPWEDYSQSVWEVKISDGITNVPSHAFSGFTKLTTVSLPDSIKSIGSCAFMDCESLSRLNIPFGITQIELATFWGCSSLTEINIPSTVVSIAASAFLGCSSIRELSLPIGLETIGSDAFQKCTSLESINLPATVTHIGYRAFENCWRLVNVVMERRNWIVKPKNSDQSTQITVQNNAALLLTNTYCQYDWYAEVNA